MDDAELQAIAEAVLRRMLQGGDVIEVEEIPAGERYQTKRWRIRLLTEDRG